MNILKSTMDFISKNILKIIFSIIGIFAFFIKGMYCFDDSPYFTSNTIYDLILFFISLLIFVTIFKLRSFIQHKLNYKIVFGIFMFCAILFIILVPLKPFSDMNAIYTGALHFSRFEFKELFSDNYWSVFPGNIVLAIFWGIILIPLPKSIITIKIINAILLYIIAVISRNIAKEYNVENYNLVYILLLTASPLFLYINHIYFDLPIILISMLALYLFIKGKNIFLIFTLLGIGKYIRSSVSIIMIAILFIYFFNYKSNTNDSKTRRNYIKNIILAIALFIILGSGLPKIVLRLCYGNEPIKSYSGWNQIYIGLNESEFGFMDNDFSYDRSFDDIVNRVTDYGPAKLTKILTKKTFWLWSQGTYQAERYAFGPDVEHSSDKFQYDTFLTKHLLNSSQKLRKIINAFMRSQYIILFFLMILAFWTENDMEHYRIFYYIIFATFLIMLVYELKSRYILQLLPMMTIFSVRGINNLQQFLENKSARNSA